jgi:hypothetical protein
MAEPKADSLNVSHLFDQAWKDTNEELSGDNDRAAAIVGCALLDARLGDLLAEFLVQNEDASSELVSADDSNAPLGTFGARIVAAYAVGLIAQAERNALRQLKKVRNAFAHRTGVSFEDQAIAAHCRNAATLCPTKDYRDGERGPSQLFQDTVALLAGKIAEQRHLVKTFGLKGTFQAVFRTAIAPDDKDRNRAG